MKKLFLTSQFRTVGDRLTEILPKSPKEMTVAFVPTAGDPYGDNKPWLDADRQKLVDMGFQMIELSLKDATREQVEETLKKADIVFVAGGNTFYLLHHARLSGFMDLIPKYVENGLIYVGSSAGSYLACPTIEAGGWRNQDKNIVGLTDLTALNLVPFIIFVHYDPKYDEILAEGKARTKYEVKVLSDNQALIVEGEKVTQIEV